MSEETQDEVGSWEDEVTEDTSGHNDAQENKAPDAAPAQAPEQAPAPASEQAPGADSTGEEQGGGKNKAARRVQQRSRRAKVGSPAAQQTPQQNASPPPQKSPVKPSAAPKAAMAKLAQNSTPPADDDVGDELEDDDDDVGEEGPSAVMVVLCSMGEAMRRIIQRVWGAVSAILLAGFRVVKRYFPYSLGVASFLTMWYLLATYIVAEASEETTIDFSAKLQYLLRAAVWNLIPIAVALMTLKESTEFVYQAFQETVLLGLNLLVMLLNVDNQCLHWLWTLAFTTAIFRLVVLCGCRCGCSCMLQCAEAPSHFLLLSLTIYNFVTVVGQDLGYLDLPQSPPITQNAATQTDNRPADWSDVTMCYLMEKVFCSVDQPAKI